MPLCFVMSGKTARLGRVLCLLPSQGHGRLAGMLFSRCNWDVSEAPVWHVALRDRPRAHGEKRAKCCLSAWDKMTWVNSVNTMTNIPPNIHTSPQLSLYPCTRTHSLWEPVAGKLIGSICCLGVSIPSQTPCTPPGIWRHQPGCGHQKWWGVDGVESEREAEMQRANLQLALLPAGMWSDRLASCARQGRPQGTDGLQIWTGCKEREREMRSWQMQKITCFKD